MEKQLPGKASLSPFCKLIALMLDYNTVQDLRVNKIVKEIKFDRVCGELDSKKCFER